MPPKKFELIKETDKFMCRSRFSGERNDYMNPSSASVTWTDAYGDLQVAGACQRASFYSRTGVKAEPTTPYTQWIFSLGKAVEEILVEQYKQMGIWVANNVKFYDKEKNLSGELDVIICDPNTGELIPLEIKSCYGYHSVRDLIKGTKKIKPTPKTSQLLQLMIYLDVFKDQFNYGKMVYYQRDGAGRREYDIRLVKQPSGTYASVDGELDLRFTLEDVYGRFKELEGFLEHKVLPPRDYELKYSSEKIEKLYKKGAVSKTAYEDWKKKGIAPGDWNCSYCGFNKICWSRR